MVGLAGISLHCYDLNDGGLCCPGFVSQNDLTVKIGTEVGPCYGCLFDVTLSGFNS